MTRDMIFTRNQMAFLSGLVTILMITCMAAAQPAMPSSFYGEASINGRPVPAGSLITAEIEGAVRGSIVTSQEGSYGENPLARLDVENGLNGQEIAFYVQTPQMSNRIRAAETAVFDVGGVQELRLTFSGEEIPKSSGGGGSSGGSSGGGSSGGGSSGSTTTGTSETPVESPPEGKVIQLELSEDPQQVDLQAKDTVQIMLYGEAYSLMLKSMSDFSVLLELDGEALVLGEGEVKELDLNGDYVTDIMISLEDIQESTVTMTFSALEKEPLDAGLESVTGYASANPLIPGLVTLIIIAALGVSVFKLRRRGLA